MEILRTASGLYAIGGPLDGTHFVEQNLASFRERFVEIRAAGYNVPEYVFEEIDAEMLVYSLIESDGSPPPNVGGGGDGQGKSPDQGGA